MCLPAGIECYKSIKEEEIKCLVPCKGVFADVQRNLNIKKVKEIEDFKLTFDEYKAFKSGYNNHKRYQKEVAGSFLELSMIIFLSI